MLKDANARRYKELYKKMCDGTMTDDEYDEMFYIEQDSLQEDCMRMAQVGA